MSYKFQYNRPNNPAQTTRICWTVQARMKQQQTLPNPWPTQRLSRWACPAGQPLLNSPIQTPDKHLTVQSLSISWYFHTLQHYQLHILLDTVWKRIIIELLIPLHIYIYIYVLAAKPLTFQESNKHIELVSNQPKLKRINANGPMGPPLVPSAMPNHLVHSSGHCQSTQPSCAWQRHGESPSQAPFPSSLSDFPQVFCRKYIGTLRLRRYLHIIFQDL